MKGQPKWSSQPEAGSVEHSGVTWELGPQSSSLALPMVTQNLPSLPSLLCDERDVQGSDDFSEKEMENLDKLSQGVSALAGKKDKSSWHFL